MKKPKNPLYRKYNKLARGFRSASHGGGEFRYQRNTKEFVNFEGAHKSMSKTRIGYDYTPLFRFLLSRVGTDWDTVFSEASQRLDKQEPIFRLVDLLFNEGDYAVVRTGATSFYSLLTVRDGLLVIADSDAIAPEKLCTCCTHSFNGLPY